MQNDPHDTRIKPCDKCGGDGGWSVESTFNPFTGRIGYRDIPCEACDATGEIEMEMEPIEMEDLEEMAGEHDVK